jgi:hypothetical protein
MLVFTNLIRAFREFSLGCVILMRAEPSFGGYRHTTRRGERQREAERYKETQRDTERYLAGYDLSAQFHLI